MRISAVGGLVSVFFLCVVFTIALTNAHHYWRELKQSKLGQSKKSLLRKLMRRWIIVAVIASIVGVAGAVCYYFAPPTKARPYAELVDSKLVNFAVGKPVTLSFRIKNAGSVEISGSMGSMMLQFSNAVHPQSLKAEPIRPSNFTFKLVPGESRTCMVPFDTFTLKEDDLKMLDEGVAHLYFFSKGEYRDESGNKYPLFYCRKYEALARGHLAICDEDIKVE